MIRKNIHSRLLGLLALLCFIAASGSLMAGTLNLSTVPLSTATSVDPNVFFELDDSGSMDWEIMTQKFWTWKAYNPDETVIAGAFNSADGGSYETDGNWTSNYKIHKDVLTISTGVTTSSDAYYSDTFDYIFVNSDNLYSSGCGTGGLSELMKSKSTVTNTTSHGVVTKTTTTTCNPAVTVTVPTTADTYSATLPYILDWRIRSSALNTVFFDPNSTYSPWVGPCMAVGTYCADASFTAARSNPREGTAGYALTTDLTGFVYEVWEDDKGFAAADGRPRRGTNVNVTDTPNGIVDLWDKHIQYIVFSDHVDVVTTTYAPDSTGMHPTTTTSTLSGASTDPYGHTVAEIQQNVANWYQYYRRRSLTAKAAISAVIDENPSFRYGLSVINESASLFNEVPPAGVADYSTYNLDLLTNLYSFAWQADGTPLRVGLKNAGDYFDGALAGKTDPIINACQKCFTVLITDGYWNESFSSIADIDGDGIKYTLADVARYYYNTDLSAFANDVVADAYDPATWQHMVTYTVAFGVQGNLSDTDGDGWPNPALAVNGNWGNPGASDPAKIDDLWHAAYNSKGTFISAKSPSEVVTALRNALQDISNRVSSLAAVSLNAGSISSLSKLYQAKFNSYTWEGYMEAKNIADGVVGATDWEAGVLLPDHSNRVILTHDGSAGVPFEWASLSGGEQTALNKNGSGIVDALGSLRLDYLRGDGGHELINGGTFRNRQTTKLGDIVNSAPQYASDENFYYPDSLEAVAYSSFVSTKAGRTPMVYVGANDGMLHGFDGATGVEKIAYVPSPVYSNLSKLTSSPYSHRYFVDGTPTIGDAFYSGAWHSVLVGGLNAGGQGIYALDVTDPTQFSEGNASSVVLWEFTDANDADVGYTFSRPYVVKMADGTWAAVFGNGYNNAEADSHTSAAGVAALYIVNVHTGALIKKISTGFGSAQDPKGTSRPNGLATVTPVDVNQDGITDYIYAGDLFGNLWKFDVSAANTASWDVAFHSGATAAPLFTACGGSPCSAANAQSITSRATVGYGPNRQGYMIYFGTGKYLESTDVGDLSTQTLYGIWDKNDGATTVSGRNQLLQQTIQYEGTYTLQDGTVSSQALRVTSNNHYSTSPPTELGWYLDMTSPVSGAEGERNINQPILRNGRIIFATIIPSSNSCSGGGDSWLVEVSALDGARLTESPFDLNEDGGFDSKEYVQVGGEWVPVSEVKYTELITTPAVATDSTKETKYMSGSSGSINAIDENPGANGSGRDSWRQLK